MIVKPTHVIFALAIAYLVGIPIHAVAAPCAARFSDSPCYLGPPDLALTHAFLDAGGGPGHFSTSRFVRAIAPHRGELASLRSRFGAAQVATFLTASDFAAQDGFEIASGEHIRLPAPLPQPSNAAALSHALWSAGFVPGMHLFDDEYLLDHLLGHSIHARVMDDIDNHLGRKADAIYHLLLNAVMRDVEHRRS